MFAISGTLMLVCYHCTNSVPYSVDNLVPSLQLGVCNIKFQIQRNTGLSDLTIQKFHLIIAGCLPQTVSKLVSKVCTSEFVCCSFILD